MCVHTLLLMMMNVKVVCIEVHVCMYMQVFEHVEKIVTLLNCM